METNMHGVKIGMLTGLIPAWQDSKSQWHWLFECECGNTKVVNAVNVRSGQTKSCGCARGFFEQRDTRAKMRAAKLGRPSPLKGVSRPEVLNWLTPFKKGYSSPYKGKKRPELAGPNNPRWIADRTYVLEKHRIRGSLEWKQWREAVFARDNFTCRECGATRVYIEPHHIIPIRSDWSKLFDTNNGITLCRPCHKKTMWKEEQYTRKYLDIVSKVSAYC